MVAFISACVLSTLLSAPPQSAPAGEPERLRADQLLLIYSTRSAASRELVEYYAKARTVPEGRLCGVDVVPGTEEISADDFEHRIRQPVRNFLEQHNLRDTVRCLVTFYDVPLRIRDRVLSAEQQRLLTEWRRNLTAQSDELQRSINGLEALGQQPHDRAAENEKDPTNHYLRLLAHYKKLRVAVYERLSPNAGTDAGKALLSTYMSTLQNIEGLSNVIRQLQVTGGSDQDERTRNLKRARAEIDEQQVRIDKAMAAPLEDPGREEARAWVRRYHGLAGYLVGLNADINRLRPDETAAAVDSELMLLWWDDYPRHRWVTNLLNWRMRADAEVASSFTRKYLELPILMTARLDAASPRVVRRIVDDALAVERAGLRGTAYIDARGMPGSEGMAKYDANLRDLAALLSRLPGQTVRLDNKAEVFAPGCCRDAALYCGWYSVRKYVAAFAFVRGAVGYHIASFEAISLRNPSERGWCKHLLDDGVAATLGSVAEPYLESFPPPRDFFGLLLTGRYTVAECFAYSCPFTSWMQILLGDPLYNPFAKNGPLTLDQVYPPELISPATQRETPR